MNYSIEEFWTPRLGEETKVGRINLPGWAQITESLPTFLEAPLELSSNYGDADPWEAEIILVSAPGAVGKTTLAKQIAFETGAVFVDLANADPVGANTLVGGLAIAGHYQGFLTGSAALIVDGLDEASMRVTQESMGAFLRDAVNLSDQTRRPIVLLGRTGAVEEAWLWFFDEGVEAAVLEIQYFQIDDAAEFARLHIQEIRGESTRREPDSRAVDLILDRLSKETLKDGGSFVGYSPVLIAVSNRIASKQEEAVSNTQEFIARIEQGEEAISLENITNGIMEREQGKLNKLPLEDISLRSKLYTSRRAGFTLNFAFVWLENHILVAEYVIFGSRNLLRRAR